jgi:hypothetical protein
VCCVGVVCCAKFHSGTESPVGFCSLRVLPGVSHGGVYPQIPIQGSAPRLADLQSFCVGKKAATLAEFALMNEIEIEFQ